MEESDRTERTVSLTWKEALVFIALAENGSLPMGAAAAVSASVKIRRALAVIPSNGQMIQVACTEAEARFVERGRQ